MWPAQKRVGVLAAGQEPEELHGNPVKVEYLLEEAIWRRRVCTKRARSLRVIVDFISIPPTPLHPLPFSLPVSPERPRENSDHTPVCLIAKPPTRRKEPAIRRDARFHDSQINVTGSQQRGRSRCF